MIPRGVTPVDEGFSGLNPESLPPWCKNIPDTAAGLAVDHSIEHIEHFKALNQVTRLLLGEFANDTFDRENMERCFAHLGTTVQWLSPLAL